MMGIIPLKPHESIGWNFPPFIAWYSHRIGDYAWGDQPFINFNGLLWEKSENHIFL